MIELNITGTLPEEIDEISTVSEFEAIKPTFYQGIANFFFILNQNIPHTRARKHDENVCKCFIFKCFIRCYLERQEILKNDILDRERGMELELARNEDILDDCSKEARGKYIKWMRKKHNTFASISNIFFYFTAIVSLDQKDLCMRAYAFLRCVAIWNLVYDDVK